MIPIPFDQFQRYNHVQVIVNKLRDGNEIFRILEVGANEHQNLEVFLPSDTITYLDINLPETLQSNPKYILGDATQMEFKDNAYDIVVALDVFEHIPSSKRENFINELNRVSARLFIITAPFYSDEVVNAESRLETLYFSMFGERFIWLEEHATNGLPVQSELEDHFLRKNIKYSLISHGNIDLWEKLMGLHFFAAKTPALIPYREKIDSFYNEYLFRYDYSETSYRKIVVGSKSTDVSTISIGNGSSVPKQLVEELNALENTFFQLHSYFQHIAGSQNFSREIDDLTESLHRLEENICEKNLTDDLQVYVDTGNGFNEEESLKVGINPNDNRTYFFNLSQFNEISSLRIDPSKYAGVFKLGNLKVNNISYDSEIDGNFIFEVNDQIFVFINEDPCIHILFNEKMKVTDLEFNFFRMNNEMLTSELKTVLHTIEEKTQIIDEINKKNRTIEELNTQLNNQLNKKESELALINSEQDSLQQKISKLEGDLQTALHNLVKEKEKVHLGTVQQELISRELEGIYSSKGWKLVSKLREIRKAIKR
ncbi:methyltransferase domain-containing protein [Paenibacillus sp. 7124]|uniref:Methyltransferase domain-containing protein n=1 Tax=Paenibacillus apii TaxID=1850370 RepID=A0A6M1PIK8_9BACL|nr:methyltransferase domain-containing protein [Paenibacillus apii]NGM82384.1 methyltransferase domain-containing protein [Paenibacillus apii]NJJ39520.1 methyltransferase domain-containing protein [Paenibacillus apii]